MRKFIAFFMSVIMIIQLMPAALASDEIPTYNLAKDLVINYMNEAKELYADDTDYSETLVEQVYNEMKNTPSERFDDQKSVRIGWTDVSGAQSYTLYVSTSEDFNTDDTLVFENITSTSKYIYNLFVNTQYYWKVVSDNGTVSDVKTFKTANTIRFMRVDGMRNVRDIGGWNGLNQGLVYRGTEINGINPNSDGSYFKATEEGIKTMVEDMGIKTDLDFRAPGEEQGNITASPLGDSVNWVSSGLGSYTSCLKEENMYKFKNALSIFANPNNYPVYFHCYGGADRTGTIAFLLEALAGASEVDLSIDFEATTFSYKVGWRRRNHPDDLVAMINGLKNFGGDNVNEWVENYALHIGLTRSQISNIRSILKGNGVTFRSIYDVATGNNVKIYFDNLNGHTVKSVTTAGGNIEHSLSGNALAVTLANEGTYTITLDDDTELVFDAFSPVYPEVSLIQAVDGEEARIECEALEATNSNDGVTGVVNKDGKRIGLNNRWAQWTINAPEDGIYKLSLIANTNYTGSQVTLSTVNGDTVTDIGTVDVECDGVHQDCITYPYTTELPAVNLKKGANTIRLSFSSGGTVSMDCIYYSLSAKEVTQLTKGTYTAKADISVLNADQRENLTFIAAVLSGDTLAKATIKNVEDADENNILTISDLQVGENGTVKLFIWNKTSLMPIMPNIIYETK